MKKDELNAPQKIEQGEIILRRGPYATAKSHEEYKIKKAIAEHVVREYVSNFDSVLLDAGSTAEIIAEEMFKKRKFLSVLTNNMGAYAAYISAGMTIKFENDKKNPPNLGNELLISGGRYVDIYESLLGKGALSSMEAFTPNVIIIGTSGLKSQEGIFCHGSEEVAVKELLWTKPVDIRLIATDWRKIGKRDASAFGRSPDFCLNAKKVVVVTNEPPREIYTKDPKWMKDFDKELHDLEERGIQVDRIKVDPVE